MTFTYVNNFCLTLRQHRTIILFLSCYMSLGLRIICSFSSPTLPNYLRK